MDGREVKVPLPEVPQRQPTTAEMFRQIARTATDALAKLAGGPKPVDTEVASWLFSISQAVQWIGMNDPILTGKPDPSAIAPGPPTTEP